MTNKESVIEHFEIELSKYRHNSETLNNKGLRTIYGRKAKMLSLLLHMAKKQIPKKVNISLKGTTDWNTKCHCPNCHSMVSHGKYCSNCGQALDFNSNGSDTE